MAKTSSIDKNRKRTQLVKRMAAKRARLKATASDKQLPPEERFAARLKLAEMPRNSSSTRLKNRCELTGRPRGYYRKFGLARNMLRKAAMRGDVPGLKKSSW